MDAHNGALLAVVFVVWGNFLVASVVNAGLVFVGVGLIVRAGCRRDAPSLARGTLSAVSWEDKDGGRGRMRERVGWRTRGRRRRDGPASSGADAAGSTAGGAAGGE